MRVPKKVICELPDDNFICEVDKEGWGRCGDSILVDEGQVCSWVQEALEWQAIEPVYLKGRR